MENFFNEKVQENRKIYNELANANTINNENLTITAKYKVEIEAKYTLTETEKNVDRKNIWVTLSICICLIFNFYSILTANKEARKNSVILNKFSINGNEPRAIIPDKSPFINPIDTSVKINL